jgi:Protein of unknown function (DUF3237)
MIEYRLEHVMSYTAQLSEPELIGPVAEGIRVNIYVTGGKISGPKLSGKFRPVGADWLTIRRDGIGILDVRGTMETTDGALIYVAYIGTVDLGENGYEEFLQGKPPASGTPIRSSPRFHTSHRDYVWLNRLHCLGIGQAFLDRSEVVYDVYAVR